MDYGDLVITDYAGPLADSGDDAENEPKKSGRGRSRFSGTFCAEHGRGPNGEPCAKFADLPGDGRGPHSPSISQRGRSAAVSLVKPLIFIGIIVFAFWAISSYLPKIVDLGGLTGGLVPKNAPSVIHSPADGRIGGSPNVVRNSGGNNSGISSVNPSGTGAR
jgi:hypothetical protein